MFPSTIRLDCGSWSWWCFLAAWGYCSFRSSCTYQATHYVRLQTFSCIL